MLITYPDSMGTNLKELNEILDKHFIGAVHGVHILPFFPSSGDRGFAPLQYDKIDEKFGTWEDVNTLAQKYPLMFDYMINHISAQSPYYQNFLRLKEASPYAGLFIRYKDFWPGGDPTQAQVDKIYKRKPRAPYAEASFEDGSQEKIWCTFSEEQIDLNIESNEGLRFLEDNLRGLARRGAAVLRMDAFAYATKKMDTNCFFVEPEVWDLLNRCANILKEENAEILPEIHEHYTIQKRIADQGFYVYDFALPMLLLHAIYFGQVKFLSHWFDICPRKQYTTLDTHDGIGVVDVKDLLPDEEIDAAKEYLFRYGANVKKIYNTEAYNNLDVYQLNCTYYSALGDDDDAYLFARAVQFFAPGIPQVYYVGLLAGKNDLQFLEESKEGRNINRHYYTMDEVATEAARPVVKKLIQLMRLRNDCEAFNGTFSQEMLSDTRLLLQWDNGNEKIELSADFSNHAFTIEHTRNGEKYPIVFN